MLPIKNIFDHLYQYYGEQHWWPADSPYEMLVGSILTQNTNWQNVEKALTNLGDNLNPNYILNVALFELAQQIRPSGYYNQKAERLKIFTSWFARYHFDPDTVQQMDADQLRLELLSIKGIGKETADCMLIYAFNKPFFIIDAYTRRLFHRLGYHVPLNYDNFRILIESQLPRSVQLFNEFHALIIKHNKVFCSAKPKCHHCPLDSMCCFLKKSDINHIL